jgi:hypothetical protein
MAVANGYGSIVTNGLVFAYDIGDTYNSYIGEPTTNYIYHQNPRIDSSYESYMPESGNGTIATNHPGAIRVYNSNGSDISYYINGGVGDWSNQRHAYWIYDNTLKRPVVRMYNENGSWQAKHFNPEIGSLTNIGISAGNTYTLSWLQYVESLDRSAWVGFYSYSNTYGYNNFWDGLGAAYNTQVKTWQRVSYTFTANNNGQLSNYHNGYMYGQAIGNGELRIADVQLEVKSHPTQYSPNQTRSATQGLLPIVDNSTIDLTNISFDSNAQIYFDGTNDYIPLPPSIIPTTAITVELIYRNDNSGASTSILAGGAGQQDLNIHLPWSDTNVYWDAGRPFNRIYKATTNAERTGIHHWVFTKDSTTGIMSIYLDGNLWKTEGGLTSTIPLLWSVSLGCYDAGGGRNYFTTGILPVAKIYNRALSSSEIQQNYQKYKTRFNLS